MPPEAVVGGSMETRTAEATLCYLMPYALRLTPDSTPAYAFCRTPDSAPALPAGGDKDRSCRRGNWGGAQEYEAAECWSRASLGYGPYYAPESGKGVIHVYVCTCMYMYMYTYIRV